MKTNFDANKSLSRHIWPNVRFQLKIFSHSWFSFDETCLATTGSDACLCSWFWFCVRFLLWNSSFDSSFLFNWKKKIHSIVDNKQNKSFVNVKQFFNLPFRNVLRNVKLWLNKFFFCIKRWNALTTCRNLCITPWKLMNVECQEISTFHQRSMNAEKLMTSSLKHSLWIVPSVAITARERNCKTLNIREFIWIQILPTRIWFLM